MADQAKIWDRFARKYAQRQISNEAAYQRKLEETQALLNPDSTIFEFGCGTGTTALHHSSYVKSVLATDVSAKMLKIAQDKAKAQGVGNVTFKQGSLEDFHGRGLSFDMIMGHSILHLLKDRKAALEMVYDMVKPQGYFVSSTVCLKGILPWARVVLPIGSALGVLPNVQFLSPKELIEEVQAAGFSIITHWQPTPKEGVFVIAQKKQDKNP